MNFWEKISKQRVKFDEAVAKLDSLPNYTPRVTSVMSALAEASALMNMMQTDMRRVDSKEIVRIGKQLQTALSSYISSIKKVKPGTAEAQAMADVMPEAKEFLTESVKSMRDAMNTLNADAGGILSTNMDEIKEKGRKRATFSNGEMDVDTASAAPGVGQLLWIGENIALAQRTEQYGQELINSRPHLDYENLISDLEDAGPAKQVEYAKLLANRERQLTAKLTRTYETLLSRYEMQQDGNRNVLEALVNDESYRDLKSYYALKNRLMQGFMAQPLAAATSRFVTSRVSKGLDIPALMDDAEEKLQNMEGGQTALASAKNKDLEALKTSGLPTNPFAQTLFGLATQIAVDPDREASPYYGIARRLFELQREDHTDPTSENYEKRVRACAFEAEAYLKSHRKVPYTEKGRRRVAAARKVLEVMQARLQEIAPKQDAVPEEEKERLENKAFRNKDELAQLARYQANVGTAKLDPPVPKRRSEVGERKDPETRGLGHMLYSAIVGLEQVTSGLPTNLVGAGMWLYHKIKGKSAAEKNAQPFDSERVPGMRTERFREPVGDGIITDKRRIPLVWERPIPEDPKQPITLTFEVDQPFEGNDVGSNWNADKVGHAFLTLKYTKVNPATGKEERYKTSFGFYPKLVGGTIMDIGMATIGTVRMGEIREDFGHEVSVGSTVTITPRQFNDIIRFTGAYEKDGYNMISRNCTDFALDAVRHAGVSIPELDKVQKVDLTNTGPAMGIGLGGSDLLLGHLLTHELTKRQVRNKLEKRDERQYSRLGQAEASLEDVERIKHSKLNSRMRGYAPGETAEAIRGSYGFALHSKKYYGTEQTRTAAFNALSNFADKDYSDIKLSSGTKTREKIKGSDRPKFLLNLMEQEIPRLRGQIEAVYGTKDPELNQVLDRLEKFQKTTVDAAQKFVEGGINSRRLTAADTREQTLGVIREGVKHLNTYVKELNTVFHDVFKSDSRVNIPFQNAVSLAERLNDEFELAYYHGSDLRGTLSMDYGDTGNMKQDMERAAMERQLYDQSRDASNAIWNANHVKFGYSATMPEKEPIQYRLLPSELLAAMLTFDDPAAAIRKFAFEPDNEKTKEMRTACNTMVNALDTYQDGHEYTDAELDAVFNRMPALEEQMRVDRYAPSAVYQTMALSAVLGDGFLGDMNAEFMGMLNARRSEFERTVTSAELNTLREDVADLREDFEHFGVGDKIEYYNKSILLQGNEKTFAEEDARAREGMESLMEEFAQFARDRLEERLRSLPPEKKAKLDHMTAVIANSLIEKTGADTAQRRNACVHQAREALGTSLVQGYLNSICQKAIKQVAAEPALADNLRKANAAWLMQFELVGWVPSAFRQAQRPAPEHQRAQSVSRQAQQGGANPDPQRSSFSGMGRK